jgi:exopolyphosphatase/guanosine-5'-triphosphate,3'-diphosphate pyrophosphatase
LRAARFAAIDIGTNSVLLLIAERDLDGRLRAVVDRARITRLGQDVDRTRALAPEAIERTLSCLGEYAEEIKRSGVDRLDVVGTSAMRDARGGEHFAERAAALLGKKPRTISGDEEATLTFLGALEGLPLFGDATVSPEVMVFDVGGGSTEFVRGSVRDRGASLALRTSLNFGSVRLYERHIRSDPPAEQDLAAVRDYVFDQLRAIPPPPP